MTSIRDHTLFEKGFKRVLPGTKRGSSKGCLMGTAKYPFLVLDNTFFLRVEHSPGFTWSVYVMERAGVLNVLYAQWL